MQTLRTHVLRLLLGALLAFAPSSARGGNDAFVAAYVCLIACTVAVGGPLETLGTIGAVKAGLEASRGYRTSPGWLTMGYLSGLANLTGAVFLLRAGSNAADEGQGRSAFFGLGALLLAWGATNLGLSIWGTAMPARSEPSTESRKPGLTFTPLLGPDGRGGLVAGLAVSMVSF